MSVASVPQPVAFELGQPVGMDQLGQSIWFKSGGKDGSVDVCFKHVSAKGHGEGRGAGGLGVFFRWAHTQVGREAR